MPPRNTIIVVSSILALLHAYIGWRVLPDLPLDSSIRIAGILFLVASFALVPAGLLSRAVKRQPLSDRLAWAGLLALGMFSSLLVLTILRDVILLAAFVPGAYSTALANWTAAAVPALAGLVTVIGLINARRVAKVVDVDVPISNLPAALHGFTIAQISDIHIGPTIKRGYLDAIVNVVNGLEADLIAVTGDLVDGSVDRLASHTAPLGNLIAKHGASFATPNHY